MTRRHRLTAVLLSAAALLSACGDSPLNGQRLETALASTFANRVHLQVAAMGLPAQQPPAYAVKTRCRRAMDDRRTGSGDWTCTVEWLGPEGQQLRDQFDLFLATDGCYTATAEGGTLGGRMVTRSDGVDVRNLLAAFDGCFDVS